MIQYVNISNFMAWFIGQFRTMFITLTNQLNQIYITNGVSLIHFIITIIILGAILPVILNGAKNMRLKKERKPKNDK